MTSLPQNVLRQVGAVSSGGVAVDSLWPFMSEEKRTRALADMPHVDSLLCGIFPYFATKEAGNIAYYARGLDYHQVLGQRLTVAVEALKKSFPDESFKAYVDISPYPEKIAAAIAGLGTIGCHTLLITPQWGSYVFIGTIATTLHVKESSGVSHCQKCRRCMEACPGGAISERGLDTPLCLSAITQKKGLLSHEEMLLLQRSNSIWGCDICQQVCPANMGIPMTPIPEFSAELIHRLTAVDLNLSRKDFIRRYGNRAFAWRGVATLRRNAEIATKSLSSD